MDTKTSPSSYHHQRAPRTPESYFNVPESIALLNIVKSERIQNAFQSNRKNHASVWEMVAEVLNRFSSRKRSAKQCCNRYENLKKIYTQLKKNPERHVRRNWPYMFLFKEIEEQRGECWGSNGKRLALLTKNHKDLSYYHRRRQAAEFDALMLNNKDATAVTAAAAVVAQHSLFQSLAQSTDASCKLARFLPNHFVETQFGETLYGNEIVPPPGIPLTQHLQGVGGGGGGGGPPTPVITSGSVEDQSFPKESMTMTNPISHQSPTLPTPATNGVDNDGERMKEANGSSGMEFEKDCNGALNLQTNDTNVSMKTEPLSEGEFNPDDIQLMQCNYNGVQSFYSNNIDPNILHPDVIVDTDNLSDCSSDGGSILKGKRKLSTSTDGDSTNYELIEYLKRREKRDEELLQRMNEREERLVNLLERTVAAIEALAKKTCCSRKD